MKFKNRYSDSKDITKNFKNPSLTDQQFKQECDIGFIVEQYAKLGKTFDQSNLSYVDCTSVQDYQEAMFTVANAKSNFESLPAKDRDRFKTVENYLEFISNAANLKESFEKGYIDRGSVSLEDVYPERFKIVSDENKTVIEDAPVSVSENVTETVQTSG